MFNIARIKVSFSKELRLNEHLRSSLSWANDQWQDKSTHVASVDCKSLSYADRIDCKISDIPPGCESLWIINGDIVSKRATAFLRILYPINIYKSSFFCDLVSQRCSKHGEIYNIIPQCILK